MTTTERTTSTGMRRTIWLVAAAIVLALAATFVLRERGQHARTSESAVATPSASGETATGTSAPTSTSARTATAADGDKPARGGRSGAGGVDRVVPVLIAAAARRDIPISVEGLGSVTAYMTVNVRTQVDGRLERVAFREGQAVHRGDLLAQVDSRPFTIQLHQAEAALARDQAQLHGAELNLQRYETVVAQKLIPQQQVDDQRALTEQLKGTIRADQAQIENARLQLAYARITSPIDGVTGIRLVDPGNVVHAADANGIVVVTQLDPIAVLFTLPQDELARVVRAQGAPGAHGKAGAGTPPVVEILDRDGNSDSAIAKGELALIDNQINQNTATLRLKAVFPNPAHQLWPNQFVKARLQLEVRKGVLVVPAAAIQRGPQGTFVYVVGDADKAVVKTVQVDSVVGADALLTSGVEQGERVITEGQNQLRPGARVSVRQPAGAATASDGGRPHPGGKRPAGGQKRAQ
jgi:membrane fusion protein, multidrug efflux system